MSSAWTVCGILYLLVILRTDWQKECDKAAERNAAARESMRALKETATTTTAEVHADSPKR
jgi:hypothetical protein